MSFLSSWQPAGGGSRQMRRLSQQLLSAEPRTMKYSFKFPLRMTPGKRWAEMGTGAETHPPGAPLARARSPRSEREARTLACRTNQLERTCMAIAWDSGAVSDASLSFPMGSQDTGAAAAVHSQFSCTCPWLCYCQSPCRMPCSFRSSCSISPSSWFSSPVTSKKARKSVVIMVPSIG